MEGFVFFVFTQKSSAISAYSAVDFFFLLGGRRDFYNFLSNKKVGIRIDRAAQAEETPTRSRGGENHVLAEQRYS